MQNLSLIACVSADYGLGFNNNLLWRFTEDQQFFKQITTGNVVVMGRKTFESIGNPLPGRENVVLSSRELKVPGIDWCENAKDLDKFLSTKEKPIFIIGGTTLYQIYLDRAAKIYLTEVHATKPADTYFPKFDRSKFDRKVLKSGEQEGIKYDIVEYTKK